MFDSLNHELRGELPGLRAKLGQQLRIEHARALVLELRARVVHRVAPRGRVCPCFFARGRRYLVAPRVQSWRRPLRRDPRKLGL